MIQRRGLLGLLGGLIVAPAVITRPGLLMPVASPRPEPLMELVLEGVGHDGLRWRQHVHAMEAGPNGRVLFDFGYGALPPGWIERASWMARVPGFGSVKGDALRDGMPLRIEPYIRQRFEWSIENA